MRLTRWVAIAVAPLAGAGVGAGAGAAAGAAAGDRLERPTVVAQSAATRTTSVGVSLREYRIAAFRSRVLPGRVRFNIENKGEDDHDFQISGPGSTRAIRKTSPEIKPGARYRLTVTLSRRGTYTLICTISDHEFQGMTAKFRVVSRL